MFVSANRAPPIVPQLVSSMEDATTTPMTTNNLLHPAKKKAKRVIDPEDWDGPRTDSA